MDSVVVISHTHYDHLSYDSLESIEDKVEVLLLPPQTKSIIPRYRFDMRELERWQTHEAADFA